MQYNHTLFRQNNLQKQVNKTVLHSLVLSQINWNNNVHVSNNKLCMTSADHNDLMSCCCCSINAVASPDFGRGDTTVESYFYTLIIIDRQLSCIHNLAKKLAKHVPQCPIAAGDHWLSWGGAVGLSPCSDLSPLFLHEPLKLMKIWY